MNIAPQFPELERTIAERARTLVERGIGRESLVALALPRAELVVWALACWRAGAAFLPIDLRYPPDRIAYMIDDARPALWIDGATIKDLAPGRSAPAGRRDLAYVIYTSGSTGKPKGVEVTHEGIANLAREQARAFAIDASSRVLQFASPSFDAFVAEIVATQHAGATLVIPPAGALGPAELRALCERERVTVATFPPSLLAILEPADFPTLRTVISAGEACSPAIAKRWSDRRFVNAYGPTEATVCATMHVVEDPDDVPIGTPLDGVDVLVLDEHLQPADVGELYIGGIGLARGYRGKPALTAAAFVPHPTRTGERMYRTGDRARRERGRLYFAGRVDDQIKLRGFRIEPGEIEHALRALPEIADAVVVARSGPRIGDQLVAYVVPRASSLDPAAVAARLRTTLPPHMVPDVISAIAELPIGPNGKVDRTDLPAPRPFRSTQLGAPSAPATEREAEIVRLYEHVLGIDRVGADDDFFALGGHSLAAMVVLGRLGGHLPMSVLVRNPTPRALARQLASTSIDPCIVPLRVDVRDRPGLFFIHPIGGNAGCYMDLAAALGDRWPVYGIQNPALVTGEVGRRTIEDMSEEYARAIRTVQPRGPYIIGGWSVGGNFAIEVARVLANAGDDVGPLVLLDSWSPTLVKQKPVIDDAMATFYFIKNNVGRAAGVDIAITPDDTRPLAPDGRMELVRSWIARIGTMPADIPLSSLRRLVDVFAQTARVHLEYLPTLYDGYGVHLEASTPAKGHPRPPSLGWDDVLPNVRRIVVPDTTHYVFVYPPMVQRVAATIREVLA